jgi:hypothetical protein
MRKSAGKYEIDAREVQAIGAIVVLALAARLINLDAGLWYDEILTLTQSVRLPPAELATTYGSLNNHVLYTWLAKGAAAIFGEEPWSLRAPAVLFGVASVCAVWFAFREAGNRWAAVAAAALLAVSYHHVWFSQNARGYTGLLLFTTLAGLALNRALTTDERRYWFHYAAFFAAAMLVHLSAAFLLLAQGLTLLIHGAVVARKKSGATLWRWLSGPLIGFGGGTLIVLAAFSPMIGGMIAEFADVAGPAEAAAAGVIEWKSPFWTIVETLKSFGVVGYAVPLALSFAAIGVARMLRTAPWLAAPYLIQIPLTLLALMALSMRVWPRYFFIDIGFLTAAVVIGAYAFAEFFAQRANAAFSVKISPIALKSAGFAVMTAASVPLLVRNYETPKQDFDGALAYIESERSGADRVATLGLANVYFNDFRRLGWPQVATTADLAPPRDGRLWVVTAFPSHAAAHFPREIAMLTLDFEEARRFKGTLSGGDVIVYRSRR